MEIDTEKPHTEVERDGQKVSKSLLYGPDYGIESMRIEVNKRLTTDFFKQNESDT